MGSFVNDPYNTAANFIKIPQWDVEGAVPYEHAINLCKIPHPANRGQILHPPIASEFCDNRRLRFYTRESKKIPCHTARDFFSIQHIRGKVLE